MLFGKDPRLNFNKNERHVDPLVLLGWGWGMKKKLKGQEGKLLASNRLQWNHEKWQTCTAPPPNLNLYVITISNFNNIFSILIFWYYFQGAGHCWDKRHSFGTTVPWSWDEVGEATSTTMERMFLETMKYKNQLRFQRNLIRLVILWKCNAQNYSQIIM